MSWTRKGLRCCRGDLKELRPGWLKGLGEEEVSASRWNFTFAGRCDWLFGSFDQFPSFSRFYLGLRTSESQVVEPDEEDGLSQL